jgi:hypothetical protein
MSSLRVKARRSVGRDRVALEAMVGKILYWALVLAISAVLVVALIIFFESRDDSSLGSGAAVPVLSLA